MEYLPDREQSMQLLFLITKTTNCDFKDDCYTAVAKPYKG